MVYIIYNVSTANSQISMKNFTRVSTVGRRWLSIVTSISRKVIDRSMTNRGTGPWTSSIMVRICEEAVK